ncbi:MAG TPA: L-2-amino-thiazoline-4-carboxylic acid hydrolase [Candidatus Bathyarchaeia archaeon]|nr:L-2-amino-thiazoline-4-carboxylic acid hydrolase [Candidatus Bathyarchaeia archaeon]
MHSEEVIPKNEVIKEVQVAMTRLALMHLAYAKTIVEEFGVEKGREVIIKAIMDYGRKVGERIKKGFADLPKYGVHEQFEKTLEDAYLVTGCSLAKIFKEYDELALGSLYCYVDPAKSMAMNPREKLIHKTCEACGDANCTLVVEPTTKEDRQHFEKMDAELKTINPYLYHKLWD